MSKEHSVIVIPGLSDRTSSLQRAVRHWQNYGLRPIVHAVGWRDGENDFQPKLARLVILIDELTGRGEMVSIVGTSAGGSAALNAFVERRDKVKSVINVCGRLRTGPETGLRSFKAKTASSPAFAQSVKLSEARGASLTAADRQKIITVRAMFGDELVPAETTTVVGAYNTLVPTIEHAVSIGAALTIFSRPLIEFLTKE